MKIVVIGGGAAGMMFSTQYKKANPEDEIILFEKSSYVAWAGCPTPYFIADELKKSDVLHGTPEDFIKRENLNEEGNCCKTKKDKACSSCSSSSCSSRDCLTQWSSLYPPPHKLAQALERR